MDDTGISVNRLDNVVPFFQSIICLDTCNALGHELLGREVVPQGYKSLGSFFHNPAIPQQEKIIVDRYLREKALRKMKSCPDDLLLFINIQPEWIYACLETGQSLPTVEMLKHSHIPGKRIVIEITESEFNHDMDILKEVMNIYRQAGFRIAIDDVGCRFSNLDRIISLNPDFIKIDANLVQGINEARLAFHMLQSMALFAQRSGIDVIFEGIETRDQFIAGLQAGARYYQGYLFSRPQPEFDPGDYMQLSIKKDFEDFNTRQFSIMEKQMQLSDRVNQILKPLYQIPDAAQQIETYLSFVMDQVLPECFRLYVCREDAYQITPNYVRSRNTTNTWHKLPEYLNRYWGWRPYFIPILTKARRYQSGILSEPYKDLESGLEICTFCYPLPAHNYLFMDLNLT